MTTTAERPVTGKLPTRQRRPIPPTQAAPVAPQGKCLRLSPDPAAALTIGASRYRAGDEPLINMIGRCLCGVPIVNDAYYGWLHQIMAPSGEVLRDVREAL